MNKYLFTCIGSRGDVQPFLAIGLRIVQNNPKCHVVFAAHEEFEDWIKSHSPNFSFTPIRGSIVKAVKELPEGRALKNAKNPFTVVSKIKSFMQLVTDPWSEDLLKAVKDHSPDFVFVSTFPFYGDLHGYLRSIDTPFLVIHTVPSFTTSEFAPPTANIGFTTSLSFLNRLAWTSGSSMAYKLIHQGFSSEMRKKAGLPMRTKTFDEEVLEDKVPVAHIYSKHILERPKDWPDNLHVVGHVDVQSNEAQGVIPDDLLLFIKTFKEKDIPVAYIGLGSMLNVMFDTNEEITRVLNDLGSGVIETNKTKPLAAILHTVTGASSGKLSIPQVDYLYILDDPVSHVELFKEVSFVVHHGGMGTTHTTAASGKPMIILPCGETTDQPFWGSIIARRHLGPRGFPISKLRAHRFSKCLLDCIKNLQFFEENAKEVARLMKEEKGIDNILSIVEKIKSNE